MLLNTKPLVDELLINRKKTLSEEQLLSEVYSILQQNQTDRNQILSTIQSKSSTNSNEFNFDLLETDRIFNEKQIKKICIDYRLRFLDTALFKNEIPAEAISKINALEKEHQTKLEGYKIVAPSKAFELKNYDDPLLFAPIGNGYYYLIHQWGNDLSWYRKWMVLPVKNIVLFLTFCFIISLVATYLTPTNKLSESVSMAPLIIFLFMFKSMVGTIGYYFFMMGKNFSDVIWDRPFKEN